MSKILGNYCPRCLHPRELCTCYMEAFKPLKEPQPKVPSYNECAKMWDICDKYHCRSHQSGWTWDEAIKFIQEHWNDACFNIDYYHKEHEED